jgi:hypothetical protein
MHVGNGYSHILLPIFFPFHQLEHRFHDMERTFHWLKRIFHRMEQKTSRAFSFSESGFWKEKSLLLRIKFNHQDEKVLIISLAACLFMQHRRCKLP